MDGEVGKFLAIREHAVLTPRERGLLPGGAQLRRNTRSKAALWVARVGGLALVALHYRQGVYEVNRLIVQKWAYAERIFSVAFLGMMFGALIGWRSDRAGAAFLMSGYLLTVGLSAIGRFSRPGLAEGPGELALVLLPFLLVGLLYAYAGRRSSFD
jgi:hypothetical protein